MGKCCFLFRNGQGGPTGDGQTLGSPAWRPQGHSSLSTLRKLKFTDICWLCLVLAGAGPGQGGCSFLAPWPVASPPEVPTPPPPALLSKTEPQSD